MWEKAQVTEAPNAEVHQFKTIGDIMKGLNPLSGKLYLDGLKMTRMPREAYSVLFGKYPHPQTVAKTGIKTEICATRQTRSAHRFWFAQFVRKQRKKRENKETCKRGELWKTKS
ncbi:hypothetical protein BH24ACI2_BH24ACI2_09900 [soil metagenome]|nr:hypothetical protein [Acidobacteriota bacterium]